MFKILKEEIVFDDKMIIEKGEITGENNNTFARLRLKRQDAAAVLILNSETNKVVLTRQFRYAISSKINEQILEIVAGRIDEGEQPLQAAIREAEEETGYRIHPEHIKLLVSCFASPGYSSERFYIYYATVTSADRVSKGGGLDYENEYISIVEMDVKEFNNLVHTAGISDAKTIIAGLYVALQ